MKTKLATTGLLMGALLLPLVGYTAEKAPAGPSSSAKDTAPPEPATKGRSDQPVDDSVITIKVKALFVKDKLVRARNIEVKTVNGVVELSGTARSTQESSQAASIAGKVKGVKSVKNDLQISATPTASAREKMSDKDRPATTRRSDRPVADSVITTKVKALFVKDKLVRARNVEVKTVNGVVELSGTARSTQESSQAASIAGKVKGVKSVKNDLQISATPTASTREKMSDKDRPATTRRSDQPVEDSVITTKLKALFIKDKEVSFRTIEVKTVNGVVELSGTAKSKQESDKAVSMARDIQGVKSVKNDIRVQ